MANNNSNGRSNFARVMSLVLVILMLLGTASTVILFLIMGRHESPVQTDDEKIVCFGGYEVG